MTPKDAAALARLCKEAGGYPGIDALAEHLGWELPGDGVTTAADACVVACEALAALAPLVCRRFPVHSDDTGLIASIPWYVIKPYERRVLSNHGQTLERLAERGGLSLREMAAAFTGRKLRTIHQAEAGRIVRHVAGMEAADPAHDKAGAKAAANRALDEALNSGDGVYRP